MLFVILWFHQAALYQQQATEAWTQRELANVVDAAYFHLVFTLPHELNGWVRLHPRLLYRLLFSSVWETLNTLGHDPKRLNGQLGMTAVLHTWGQNLNQHVHLHCLIPAGALNDAQKWHPANSTYLFPIRVLSRLFRGKLVTALREAANQGELHRVTHLGEIDRVLATLMSKDWVVYAKPCLHKAETVVRYLARYTRKIAISEYRLLSMTDETVSFRYQDYRDGQRKVMTLAGAEFLRRYLQHMLPHGFMRIRHFGWLANASRKKALPLVRQAIAQQGTPSVLRTQAIAVSAVPVNGFEGIACPCCQSGLMRVCSVSAHSAGIWLTIEAVNGIVDSLLNRVVKARYWLNVSSVEQTDLVVVCLSIMGLEKTKLIMAELRELAQNRLSDGH